MCSPLTNVSASPLHSCTPVPCNADLLNTAYRGTESSACRKLCTLCMDVCSLLLPWPAAEPRRHCCLGHRMLRLLFRLPVPCLQVIAGEHHSHCPMVIGLAIQEHGPSQGTPGPPGAWLDHATYHGRPPAQSLRQGSHLCNALTSRAIPQGKHKKGYEKLYTKREKPMQNQNAEAPRSLAWLRCDHWHPPGQPLRQKFHLCSMLMAQTDRLRKLPNTKTLLNPIQEEYMTTHRAVTRQTWSATEGHHLMPMSGAAVGTTSGCSLLQLGNLSNLGGRLAGEPS